LHTDWSDGGRGNAVGALTSIREPIRTRGKARGENGRKRRIKSEKIEAQRERKGKRRVAYQNRGNDDE
jgi:hypothetical protein